MSKIVAVILTLCMLAVGTIIYAEETPETSAIPNMTTEVPAEDSNGRAVQLDTEDVEAEDLNPVERKVITQDTIRSNTGQGLGN